MQCTNGLTGEMKEGGLEPREREREQGRAGVVSRPVHERIRRVVGVSMSLQKYIELLLLVKIRRFFQRLVGKTGDGRLDTLVSGVW